MNPLLEVQDVSVRYAQEPVLSHLTFSVAQGEFVALIGPNGSGKSSLVRALCGLAEYEGSIQIEGKELETCSAAKRAGMIAVSMQFLPDFSSYSVQDLVLLGRVPFMPHFKGFSQKDYALAKQAIASCRLNGLEQRLFSTLSGGEKQRCAIACALCSDSEMLICDEPTNHLDIGHQLEVMRLLERLHTQGKTIFVVLHDLNLAARFCRRLILLDRGRIVRDGTCAQVLEEKMLSEVYGCALRVCEDTLTKSLRVQAL